MYEIPSYDVLKVNFVILFYRTKYLPSCVMVNGNVSKNKVINKTMLAYTFVFFLKITVAKSLQTPSEFIFIKEGVLGNSWLF